MSTGFPAVRAGLAVAAGDGACLATDVFLPAGGRPAPAVLLRTYLGKASHLAEGLAWAREGFAFVAQDVRGRFDSDGRFEPLAHEREDGAAALAWVAEQPWCDGRVALAGGSYAAATAWAAALSGHAAAAAVLSSVPAMRRVNTSPGGVLKLYNHACWWTTHAAARTPRTGLFAAQLAASPDLLATLPLTDLPRRFWVDLPDWSAEVGRAAAPGEITDGELAACPLPALHVGGWHDPFVGETFRHWEIAGRALAPWPRRGLIAGPWTHELRAGRPARHGERDYGADSRLPLGACMAGWLRGVLGMADDAEPPVRCFLAGEDRWLAGESWPPWPVASRSFFAAAGGTLRAEPSAPAGAARFDYDPRDPYPARSGPVDQRDLFARRDAARFATGPLPEPLTVLGSPRVVLWAATDAPGTDWVARLHEVLPDGRALYLGHALLDAAWAVAQQGGRLVPGEAHRCEIALPPIALALPRGHSLCLEITSSSFPEHARNLNTGADRHATTAVRVARQSVLYGPAAPTALLLPVAEGGR